MTILLKLITSSKCTDETQVEKWGLVGELQLWQLRKRGLKNFSFNVIQTHVSQILVGCHYKLYLRATGRE